MIAELKTYSDYKPSGVEWLGDVPAHWRQLHGRACYYEKKIPNTGMQETTVLSLSYGQIVVKPVEELHGLVPASFETYQIVEPGDIIIRPTDLQNDWNSLRSGLSSHHGVITSAYMCFYTKGIMSREYGHLLLHTYDLKKVFYGLGSGLRQNLSWSDFNYLPCLVPPLAEQTAIVRYLDHTDERIRGYISSRERLIELLEEYRQAVIHHAVTRGLDPDVRLKLSGVEWLGDMPAHWEVRRFKTIGKNFTNGTTAEQLQKGISDFPVSRIESISTGQIDYSKVGYLNESTVIKSFYLQPDDFLISHINSYERVGNSARYKGERTLIHGMNLIRVTPLKVIVPNYLEYLLKSLLFIGSMQRACKPAINQVSVTTTAIKAIQFPLPPLPEQAAIVRYLDNVTANIDAAIDRARREIELLGEYRTCLIADVVTGKVDVREAVAELSEPLFNG